jgi:hypothetical protein
MGPPQDFLQGPPSRTLGAMAAELRESRTGPLQRSHARRHDHECDCHSAIAGWSSPAFALSVVEAMRHNNRWQKRVSRSRRAVLCRQRTSSQLHCSGDGESGATVSELLARLVRYRTDAASALTQSLM